MTTPERHLASHVFNVAVLVVGAAALVWLTHRLGLANAEKVLSDVGGWFAVILGLDVAAMACDAAAIHAFMRPEARMVSYWRVFAAQASGRAVNILAPGGIGEATKVTMLVGHAPRDRVVSSIVLYNLATFYLSVAIVAVGVPITALLVDLPPGVWIGLGVLVVLVAVLGVVIHRGAAGTLVGAVRGLRLVSSARAAAWRAKLLEIDSHLRELHADRSPGTHAGLALIAASRLFQWAATLTVLRVVGVELHPVLVVGVLSVGVLIGWMSAIVPFGIGVADGGNYALYGVLGATGANGVFVTMVGRARSLVLALFGLVVMAATHTINRAAIARRNRRFTERHA